MCVVTCVWLHVCSYIYVVTYCGYMCVVTCICYIIWLHVCGYMCEVKMILKLNFKGFLHIQCCIYEQYCSLVIL